MDTALIVISCVVGYLLAGYATVRIMIRIEIATGEYEEDYDYSGIFCMWWVALLFIIGKYLIADSLSRLVKGAQKSELERNKKRKELKSGEDEYV